MPVFDEKSDVMMPFDAFSFLEGKLQNFRLAVLRLAESLAEKDAATSGQVTREHIQRALRTACKAGIDLERVVFPEEFDR